MRRVSQKQLLEVDERGVRKPGSHGDCVPACLVPASAWSRALSHECPYHAGFWIAGIESPRFKVECSNCSPEREESDPAYGFWRRDECPWCESSGLAPGWHAIVMDGPRRAWDPHPDVDWDEPRRVCDDG